MDREFNLEYQYTLYLQRMALTESKMHPEQRKQLKETFFGACGQLLVLMRDGIAALEEGEAVNAYQNLLDQVGDFFLNKKGEQN